MVGPLGPSAMWWLSIRVFAIPELRRACSKAKYNTSPKVWPVGDPHVDGGSMRPLGSPKSARNYSICVMVPLSTPEAQRRISKVREILGSLWSLLKYMQTVQQIWVK